MAELKTKPTDADVNEYVNGIVDESMREDSFQLIEIMRDLTGSEPRLWGTRIIGFGDYHYKYSSGCEGDWFKLGFAVAKTNLTVYTTVYLDKYEPIVKKLGKVKTSKSCLYIKRLRQIDLDALRELLLLSLEHTNSHSPAT